MQIDQSLTKSTKNSHLVAILIILILIIFGLAAGIVWLSLDHTPPVDKESLIDTSEKMAGWDGPITDSTRAAILTGNIKDRLSSDPNYNPDQAVAEYQSVYDQATGNLKLYVAIEYANYVYDTYHDLDRALQILDQVSNLINDSNEISYYGALYNLYNQAGNIDEANYYQQILLEKSRINQEQREEITQ